MPDERLLVVDLEPGPGGTGNPCQRELSTALFDTRWIESSLKAAPMPHRKLLRSSFAAR